MSQILYNHIFDSKTLPATIDETLRSAINGDKLKNYFFVVPTGKIVKHLERKILFDYYEHTGKPLGKLNIFTLKEFAKYCFAKLYNINDYHIISEAYRLALFEEVVNNANLEFFKGKKDRISYALLERLAGIVSGLKEDGITEKEIVNNLNATSGEGNALAVDIARLSDIYNLYVEYQKILGDKYLDDTELLNKTTEGLSSFSSDIGQFFPEAELIIFEGFSEFKKPELDFIACFAQASVPMLINIDYDDKQGPLYTILEDSINKLTASGFGIKNKDDKHRGERLAHLKHNLFGYGFNKHTGFSDIIKIIESPSRVEEVILIARLVKFLILKQNIQPSEICIALRQPGNYSPLFREVFLTHKIPANIMERFELANSPVITGIIAALNLIINGFRRDDLIKFLKNPFFTIPSSETIDVDNLISLTIDLRIVGGVKRGGIDGIINSLNRTAAVYKKKIELINNNPDIEKSDLYAAKKFLVNIQKGIKDLSAVRDSLSLQEKKLLPAAFRKYIFENLIENLHVVDNIKKHLSVVQQKKGEKPAIERNNIIEEVEKNSKALKKLYDLLNEMVYVLSNRFSGKMFTLPDLMERFKTAVYGSKYQISEKIGYGVTVTTIEQTRQIPYKVMILAGAVDGEFPTPYRPETFLGMKLESSERRHILSERMQFFQFMTNAPELLDTGEKQIYISYPKFTEERELVRSPFVDALLKITTLEEDDCVIDYSIVKSAVINNDFGEQVANLIKLHPWLFSVASEIDVQSSYARAVAANKEIEEKTFDNISLYVKKNIQSYLKFITDGPTNAVRLDKSSLPDDIKQKFDEVAEQPFSITELENYAKCPYFYFLNHILRLQAKDELELGMTPLETGNILHKAVYEFYTEIASSELNKTKIPELGTVSKKSLPALLPVRLDISYEKEYLRLLKDITGRLLDEIAFDYPLFQIDRNAILGAGNQAGIADIWLRNELRRIENGWTALPVLFEFGFGMKTLSNFNIPVVDLDGLKLKGKIDRVEILNDSEEFIIADYKLSTNITASNKMVNEGKVFQMPLYMLAMEKIFNTAYGLTDWKPTGSIYYFFKTRYKDGKTEEYKQLLIPKDSFFYEIAGKKDRSKMLVSDYPQLRDFLDNNLAAAKTIVEKIGNGVFDIEPDSKACDYCQFESICRINHL
jgi:ATP-dependent helicase/nuclease subunit B